MLTAIAEEERARFPVRFVVQSGDAVVTSRYGNQWDVSFNPLIVERTMYVAARDNEIVALDAATGKELW